MNVRNLAAIGALLSISVVVFAQTARRDGNWEVTMTMEMPGMPAGMPPMTATQCVTKEQAADPQRAFAQVPQRGNQQSDCKVSDFKTSGNKVTYKVKCTTP